MIAARALATAALLAAIAPLTAVSCGEKVLLGGSEPVVDPACVGAVCGATCTIAAACAVGATACAAAATTGYCDPDTDLCLAVPPLCPDPPPPCAGQPCGTPCEQQCPDGGDCPPMPSPLQCNGAGECVSGPLPCACPNAPCTMYDACAGLACGAPCSPCDPMDVMCATPPPVMMVCDVMGACVPATGMLCPGDPGPCALKACGDPCSQCPASNPMCMEVPGEKFCDASGTCVLGMVACPPDPTPDAGPMVMDAGMAP